MADIGYAYLHKHFSLPVLPPKRPARVSAVNRVTPREEAVLVPASVAPSERDPLAHLVFALKHEGVNLPILLQSLTHVTPEALRTALRAQPSSAYLRRLGLLWEHAWHQDLTDCPDLFGTTAPLFDPRQTLTARQPQRHPKWRVAFNGLGSLEYCVLVEPTSEITQALASDLLGQATEFWETTDTPLRERALSWAYLHETQSSYAIERERVSADKAESFMHILREAGASRLVDETYLVNLQNAVVTNPLDRAFGYRTEQNWLQGPLRGAAGVTYVPPAPSVLPDLMGSIEDLANTLFQQTDPLVAASLVSFAFVFAHPFMDGNGRLSRFLFHRTLAQSGRLPPEMLLPISVAMKRHERAYLAALENFSRPARMLWDVRWIDEGQYTLRGPASDAVYRYWEGTAAVTFGLRMAQEALRQDLQQEVALLATYDTLFRRIDAAYDVRQSDLTTLIIACLDNGGRISQNRRRRMAHAVPPEVFTAIEEAYRDTRETGASIHAQGKGN